MPSALPFCFAHWVGCIETLSFQFSILASNLKWFFEFVLIFSMYLIQKIRILHSSSSALLTMFLSWWYKMTWKLWQALFWIFISQRKKEDTKLHRIKRDLSNFLIGFTLPFPFRRCMAKGWTLSNILWCSVFKNYTQNWVKWLEHVKRKTLNFNNVFYVRLPSAFLVFSGAVCKAVA